MTTRLSRTVLSQLTLAASKAATPIHQAALTTALTTVLTKAITNNSQRGCNWLINAGISLGCITVW